MRSQLFVTHFIFYLLIFHVHEFMEVEVEVEVQVEVQVEAQVESSAYPAKATDDINYMRKEVAAIIQFLK
jgi:hypothetical protein